jgi:secreted PhoX family phosphatase
MADALYAADVSGPGRALTRRFFVAPRGAEVTGACFTPDASTLFLSVQHPGQESESSFDRPTTRWPDFSPKLPPRPSVLAISKKGGGPIG